MFMEALTLMECQDLLDRRREIKDISKCQRGEFSEGAIRMFGKGARDEAQLQCLCFSVKYLNRGTLMSLFEFWSL